MTKHPDKNIAAAKNVVEEASTGDAIAAIRSLCPPGGDIVFVSGNFNIIHPGHLRLLNFAAECGDLLVVGIIADDPNSTTLPENLRLEGIRSIGVVDYALILRVPPEDFIAELKPSVVVKGKEHETLDNPELAAVTSYGGKLLFSSGDVRFSSLDLLRAELYNPDFSTIVKPVDFQVRHGFKAKDLVPLVRRFTEMRVLVVGDLIVDEYISCDALGMSQEDPTLVVSPIGHDRFVGGAGIVAAHAAGLGAKARYLGVIGNDESGRFAGTSLKEYGVAAHLIVDDSRPTTTKQRYRVKNKTLLRVSHLRQHDISAELAKDFAAKVSAALDNVNLVVFSDFNYGCLPQPLVDVVIAECDRKGIMMVADSQASSQMGDVSRFRGMRLLTPTEYEARLAMRDFRSGLVTLAETLRRKAEAKYLIVTLGVEGMLIQAPDDAGSFITDQLSSFNQSPKDVAGAGDCLLICASLAIACGADIWQSAYLGSVAAACQVSRVGNLPLAVGDLVKELRI